MDRPTLTIVVPSQNQAQYLEENLRSLSEQRYEPLEVIVIDGGSNDASPDIIRRHAVELAYWVSEPDQGQSDALNKGFERATGEWLSWLNSDDTLLPGAVRFLVEQIRVRPDLSWCAAPGWFVDEAGRQFKHYEAPPTVRSPQELSPWTDNWFAQPGTFFRRELYEKAGGHVRVDLQYAMDLDLWLRLARHAPLERLDRDMGTYRVHSQSKTMDERAAMEVEVIQVLYEHLGWEGAERRIRLLAEGRFGSERRYRDLARRLQTPSGLAGLIRKHGAGVLGRWLGGGKRSGEPEGPL